jgi:transposase
MAGNTYHLNTEELVILTEMHRACKDKKTADRIKTILMLNNGFTYLQISEILLIDERTINRYKKLYLNQGVDGLIADNYQGGFMKMTDEQISRLKEKIESIPFATAAEVCEFVWKEFGIRYTAQGMVKTLHRLGYSYKKTCPIPGKHDRGKQEAFVRKYNEEFKVLPDNEKVYFLDGSHPTFNNHPGYAWIKTGSNFLIKSHAGREHLNLMGALNPKDQETIVKNYPVLNRDSVIDFLKTLRKKNPGIILHVIWDNVPYQHSKLVKENAKNLGINLVYLPPYSPNLNLIERYWGFLRKYIMINKCYSTFDEFRDTILRFTKKKSERLKRKLKKYIPEMFHLLPDFSG